MNRALAIAVVILSLPGSACLRGAGVRMHSEDNNPERLAQALAVYQAPEPDKPINATGKPLAFLATRATKRDQTPQQLIAYDLADKKELWRVATEVQSRVLVSRDFVAHRDGTGKMIGRSMTTGEVRWSVDVGEFLGAATDAERLYYVYKDASGAKPVWWLVAVDGTTGQEVWRLDAPGTLGAPAAQGGLVFSPFLKQWLGVIDASSGAQLARLRGEDEEISFVRTTAEKVYFGSRAGVFAFDEKAASGKRALSTYGRAAYPEQFTRAHYHWDSFDSIENGYSAYDRNRLLWRGQLADVASVTAAPGPEASAEAAPAKEAGAESAGQESVSSSPESGQESSAPGPDAGQESPTGAGEGAGQGAGDAWPLHFADGLTVVYIYRFFFAFDATTGVMRWAYNNPRYDVVGASHVGRSIVFVSGLGEFGALDPKTGRRLYRATIDDQLVGVTFDAEGFAPDEESAPASTVTALASIAKDKDKRFNEVQRFAVSALASLPGAGVTRDLIALIQNERTSKQLYDRAVDVLITRQEPRGLGHIINALQVPHDYITGSAPRSVGVLARAIAALGDSDKVDAAMRGAAVDALLLHLFAPQTSADDLVDVVRALGAMGKGAELAPLSRFVLAYRSDPAFEKNAAPMHAAIDVLLAQGGAGERELVGYLADEPRTLSSVAEYARRAVQQAMTQASGAP